MIELVICEEIRKGYKVVVPKNTNVKVSASYSSCVYTSPRQVSPSDKLIFINWMKASEEDRSLWRNYL